MRKEAENGQFFKKIYIKSGGEWFFCALQMPLQIRDEEDVDDWWPVWPEKVAKCLLKLPKNDFTKKMIDFDTFAKIV